MIKAIRLRFISPVHLGRGKEELDKSELVYHSDSLKSAIYSIGLSQFQEWADEEKFFNSFRISSCFPYAEHEFFLPRPMLKRKISFQGIPEDLTAKKAKKIEYLERSVFFQLVNSENELKIDSDKITPDGSFVCTNSDLFSSDDQHGNIVYSSFYKSDVQQRVQVSSDGKDSKPYYIERIFFRENCGMYFLAEFDNEILEKQVMQTLKILGDNGIGTDRTVGNGLFDFNPQSDVTDFPIDNKPRFGLKISLGLFLPSEDDHSHINFDESAWSLIKRGGYMAASQHEDFRHLRKKTVYMFGEGSVFATEKKLKGKYTNLAPNWNDPRMHKVWRDGKCLMLNI